MYKFLYTLQGGLTGHGLNLNKLVVRAGIWIIGNVEKDEQKMTSLKGNGSCLHVSRYCSLFTGKSYAVSTLNEVLDSKYPKEQYVNSVTKEDLLWIGIVKFCT